MTKERYLFTGANGFIGSNVVRHFHKQGADVVALVGPSRESWRIDDLGIKPISVDITDSLAVKEIVKKHRPSHIINLATYGVYRDQKDSNLIYKTNTIGAINLFEAAKDIEIDLVVNTGSVYEYGSLPGPMTEDMVGETRNPYDAAKKDSTDLATSYHRDFGLPIVTLRLFTTYGPFEDKRRLVGGTILKALQDLEILVSPEAIRDFIHVNDVVNAYTLAVTMNQGIGEVMNIGFGKPLTAGEVVTKITEQIASNSKIKNYEGFAPLDDSRCWADVAKAKQLLGWNPEIDIDSGLRETIEWYKTNAIKYKQYE